MSRADVASAGLVRAGATRLLLHPISVAIPLTVIPVLVGMTWSYARPAPIAGMLTLISFYWAGLNSGYANSGST
jgi:hypothetical protein